jgi:flavin reductase (DIM6/NTAB) family NADH-FMN oxidoreductase RutF
MRQPVELAKAYRLLNHGPTVIVSAAHAGRRNAMAAAWAMPLDFNPPKVAVVIDKSTYTRGLIEASGHFALNLPTRDFADAAYTLGSHSGHDIDDKIAAYGLQTFAASETDAPLLEGCVGWLECRLLREPHLQQTYDLFLGEVIAAQADARVFADGRWHLEPGNAGLRTIHHVAGGMFLSTDDPLQAHALPSPRKELA